MYKPHTNTIQTYVYSTYIHRAFPRIVTGYKLGQWDSGKAVYVNHWNALFWSLSAVENFTNLYNGMNTWRGLAVKFQLLKCIVLIVDCCSKGWGGVVNKEATKEYYRIYNKGLLENILQIIVVEYNTWKTRKCVTLLSPGHLPCLCDNESPPTWKVSNPNSTT